MTKVIHSGWWSEFSSKSTPVIHVVLRGKVRVKYITGIGSAPVKAQLEIQTGNFGWPPKSNRPPARPPLFLRMIS